MTERGDHGAHGGSAPDGDGHRPERRDHDQAHEQPCQRRQGCQLAQQVELLRAEQQLTVVERADEVDGEAALGQLEPRQRQVERDDQGEDRHRQHDQHRGQQEHTRRQALGPAGQPVVGGIPPPRRCRQARPWGGRARRGRVAHPKALLGHAEGSLVGRPLVVPAEFLGDLVPAGDDLLDRLVGRGLAGQRPVDRGVEHDLLVALVLRHAQVEHHVRAAQAGLDCPQVVLGGPLAHPGLEPQVEVLELRDPVRVEAAGADRDVLVRLLRLRHVGQEGVGRVLGPRVLGGVDRPRPAAERRERRVVHPLDRVRAGGGVAGDQLAGRAVDHLRRAWDDDRADLVLHRRGLGVDRQRADVAPIQGQSAAAGGEQAARVTDVEVDLVRRSIPRGLDVDVERLPEALVVDQRRHGLGRRRKHPGRCPGSG